MKTCTCIISEERAPRKRGAHASKRPRIRLPLSSTATGYTDITDGKETEVAEVHALLLSPPAPMEFTIPAEIGNYLPLEVKLNIVLEVAFDSSQPGMRQAGELPLHLPRIKATRRDKNVDSVDTL